MMEIVWIILKIVLWVLCGAVSYVLLCVLGAIITSLFVKKDRIYDRDNRYFRFVFNSMTGLVLLVCGVKIAVKNRELLPAGRFLIVSNHVSNFDPIVAWFAFKDRPISYISKPSNLKIPFFGALARRCCFMSIDRQSARNAAVTIEHAAELIKSDEVNVGVYPEGTRSKTGELGRFHNCVFKIAQKANVPIVIMRTEGTENIKKNAPFKKSRVVLDIIRVLSAEETAGMPTAEIGDITRACLLGEELNPAAVRTGDGICEEQ